MQPLLPLLRQFCHGEYAVALGGAHAKGVDDAQSDIDIYVFARDVLPVEERDRLTVEFSADLTDITSWSLDGEFVQGGTDFYYRKKKVEIWFREINYISRIIAECQAGIAKRDLVTWTVMGFFNYCTLSDLSKMVPVEDPYAILASWQAAVSRYSEKLKQRIIAEYLSAAKFWPDNFHYKTAIARCDLIYVMGIVQQVVHNLIQVVFALNEVYFPGEKKMEAALDHLPLRPEQFAQRINHLIFPSAAADQTFLEWQRSELIALVSEIEALIESENRLK